MMTALIAAFSLTIYGGTIGAYDNSYSPDNPPGPSFIVSQKQEQRVAGLRMLSDLRAAYAADADSFTIPPGDYRFGVERGGADSFELRRDRKSVV